MGRRAFLIFGLAVTIVVAGGAAWWVVTHRGRGTDALLLYGNVDLRQAELAFNNNQRIASVLVQEGDHVKQGQLLATLDTTRLEAQFAQAQAEADAQQHVVERMKNGSRPEEIAQAKANLQSAQADLANARQQYDRISNLAKGGSGAVSQQDQDNAKAALDVAAAKVAMNQKALDLQQIGPRQEDIAQAEAMLRADRAQADFYKRQLADARLLAPSDGVIRSRLMEPGEMASPQTPVFSLALIDPKWVRAYVSEPGLGKLRPGMPAQVHVDSFPDRSFEGWIGFISPTAEFTPKSVQTEELRTSLVYEVRVFVKDPADQLRLGMPATVRISPAQWNATPSTQPQ